MFARWISKPGIGRVHLRRPLLAAASAGCGGQPTDQVT